MEAGTSGGWRGADEDGGHSPQEREQVCQWLREWAARLAEVLAQVRFNPDKRLDLQLSALENIVVSLDLLLRFASDEQAEALRTQVRAVQDQLEPTLHGWREGRREADG